MKITPLEIKKQHFKVKVKGFDPTEVETFLEMVADEYENILNERNQFSEEVTRLKTQLRDYQQVEKTLQDTLMNAQETVSQSRENSKREAHIILREAELKAERILDEAREKLDRMKNELSILKAQKISFARRLKHLLESQMELIKVLEMDDVGFIDNTERPAHTGHGKPVQRPRPKMNIKSESDSQNNERTDS